MEKILYFEELYSSRRQDFIDRAVKLQQEGKNFLYILPSREAIRDVRYGIIDKNSGMVNSKVIMFDELEQDITEAVINEKMVIPNYMESLIISDICKGLSSQLLYFNKIKDKKGFQEEVQAFIKYLKRNCVTDESFKECLMKISNPILTDKLKDLELLYSEYNKRLADNGIYDVNDLSLKAVEAAGSSKIFDNIDTIFIDGFINIDKVNIDLLKEIVNLNKVNILVNCPYNNALTKGFISLEIKGVFSSMGFEVREEAASTYNVKESLKELALKFYSGDKMETFAEGISIFQHPCIESEVRHTARNIKTLLLSGESPENIAIYINNREDYSSQLITIFNEFNIPIGLKEELPLAEAVMLRKAIEQIEVSDNETLKVQQWIEKFKSSIKEAAGDSTGLIKKVFNESLEAHNKLSIKALEAARKLFSELSRSINLCGLSESVISRSEFIAIIKEHINNTNITMERADNSGIRVLNTDLAKGVYFKHIYILGLNEGEVPKIAKSAGLFDVRELMLLKNIGIAFKDSQWELQREKIRFNLALASAKASITLSYRGAQEDGKYAIASSLIESVKYTTGIENIEIITMRDRFSNPIKEVMSCKELKAELLKSYFESKYKGSNVEAYHELINFIEGFEGSIKELINLALAEYHRHNESSFNRYEGMLEEEFKSGLHSLGKLSPSKINRYMNCPFGFMLEQIFELKEELVEEDKYSAMEIGNFYHSVLKNYYGELKNFEELDSTKFNKVFHENVNNLRKLEIDKEEIDTIIEEFKSTLESFTIADLKRMKNYEKATGNIIRPFALELFLENSKIFGVPIGCKIDRVDLEYECKDGKEIPTGRYIVYDYKKKNPPGIDEFLNKGGTQVVFYYYMVEEYLKTMFENKELDCMGLIYLGVEGSSKSVKKNGLYRTEYKQSLGFTGNSKFDMDKKRFLAFIEFLKTIIMETIEEAASGKFPYKILCSCFDKFSFKGCSYDKLCRFSSSKMEVIANE